MESTWNLAQLIQILFFEQNAYLCQWWLLQVLNKSEWLIFRTLSNLNDVTHLSEILLFTNEVPFETACGGRDLEEALIKFCYIFLMPCCSKTWYNWSLEDRRNIDRMMHVKMYIHAKDWPFSETLSAKGNLVLCS